MNTKMAGILAGSLLAMMAIAPMGLAHDDVAGNNRVYGVYAGAAGPWVDVQGQDIFAGNALCDLEILSDGDISTTDDNFLDEPLADGTATSPPGGPPSQAENAWGDGGNGAACHTPSTHYVTPGFNTQECNYAPAHATDDNAGDADGDSVAGDAWISTGCDYITNVPSATDPTVVELVLNAVNCVVNAVITVNVPEIVFTCVDDLLDCTIGTGNVNLSPDACPAGAGGQACGPDGTIDAGFAGNGNTAAGVAFPTTYPYAPTPTTTGTCASTAGVATVFVWDAVESSGNYAATTGVIS